jgi:hypothetical protein
MTSIKYCCSLWSRLGGYLAVLFVQGDSEGKVSILGGDNIGHVDGGGEFI